MFARCTICLDSLGRRKPPLSTACGHLYCAHCAERHFINGARCAMCRDGPYRLHQLIRLFPDYETDPGDGASSSSSRGSTSAVTTSRPQDTVSRASSQLGRQSIAQLVTTCIADLLLNRRRRGYQIPAPPTTPVSRTPPRYSSIMNQRLLADVANSECMSNCCRLEGCNARHSG